MQSELRKKMNIIYSDAMITYDSHRLGNLISEEKAIEGLEKALFDLKDCLDSVQDESPSVRTNIMATYRNHRREIIKYLKAIKPEPY